MEEAAQVLLGTHDFSTFRSLNDETHFRSPVKTLLRADVTPGVSMSAQHDFHRHLEFWEITFRSRSFLYKQVRRLTGALVMVGQGRLTPRHIKELLDMRDSRAFPSDSLAPPDGLFLKEVEYDEKGKEPSGWEGVSSPPIQFLIILAEPTEGTEGEWAEGGRGREERGEGRRGRRREGRRGREIIQAPTCVMILNPQHHCTK
uniref:tRNA pseudouridine synthase n=1 Tax=Callorhinchus milii TaxID=7868 RepID=A0A4W3GT01_CALMI